MTAMQTAPNLTNLHTPIGGELLDALIEAVVLPPDRGARATAICSLVHEMCATVEWLQDSGIGVDPAAEEELRSVRRVADAADEHRMRMAGFGGDLADGGVR